jgi:hypothetical protein
MTTTEDQDSIQALATHRTDESLGKCVGSRRSDRRADDPSARGAEDLVEAGRELGIAIPD